MHLFLCDMRIPGTVPFICCFRRKLVKLDDGLHGIVGGTRWHDPKRSSLVMRGIQRAVAVAKGRSLTAMTSHHIHFSSGC